ncbi:MAG: zinc-dependent alcohol dehydrogenase [Bacillota bacterium]
MKAVCIKGPQELIVADIPVPEPGPGEVLIRVKYCGICGSDLHLFHLGMPAGLVMGHELTGDIAACGPGVENWRVGQAVAVNPIFHCNSCYYCRRGQFNRCLMSLTGPGLSANGGMAEYMLAKTYMLRILSGQTDYRSSALIEPAAVALRAVNLADVSLGDTVLVTGAGPIGLLAASLAILKGARVILVEKMKERRELVPRTENSLVIKPEEINSVFRETEAGVDAAIECSGTHGGFLSCFNSVRGGGVIVMAGIAITPFEFDPFKLTLKEIVVRGSYGYQSEFEQAQTLIERGILNVNPFISREIDLEETNTAFKELSEDNGMAKVLVSP